MCGAAGAGRTTGDSGPSGAALAIGATSTWAGAVTAPTGAALVASKANGAPWLAAVAAWIGAVLVVRTSASVVALALDSAPVAAIAGLAEAPAATAVRAAAAVTVASRVVLLADWKVSRRW